MDREIALINEVPHATCAADPAALRNGVLLLHVEWPMTLAGELSIRRLTAVFPDSYPYTRPHVYAHDFELSRHINFESGRLCLLQRDSSAWYWDMTLRQLLDEMLPRAVIAAEALQRGEHAEARRIEAPEADSLEYQISHSANACGYLLIDGRWDCPLHATEGIAELSFALDPDGVVIERPEPTTAPLFRGLITKLRGLKNLQALRWQGPVPAHLQSTIKARWRFLGDLKLTRGDVAEQLKRQFRSQDAVSFVDQSRASEPERPVFRIFIGLFNDETTQHQKSTGWCALLATKRGRKEFYQVIPVMRAGPDDLGRRVPAVQALRKTTAAVIGLGAIGSFAAIDLARNGARQLRLLDGDIVEPGNSIRWALGASSWGLPKARYLERYLTTEYPWTSVTSICWSLGSMPEDLTIAPSAEKREPAKIEKTLRGADIVIDATAELGINHYVADLCHERGLPLVVAWGTLGIYGGVVALLRPGGPCWHCLSAALYSSDLNKRTISEPPYEENQTVELPGCSDRTFTGASYDINEIGLQVMRVVVGALNSSEAFSDNVFVLHMRDKEGRRIVPRWEGYELQPLPGCSCRAALE